MGLYVTKKCDVGGQSESLTHSGLVADPKVRPLGPMK